MKIEIEISDAKLVNIIAAARISYWGSMRTSVSGRVWYVSEHDTGLDELLCNQPAIRRGLEIMASKYPKRFAEVLSDLGWDSWTGDALVQCAVFGELKYG